MKIVRMGNSASPGASDGDAHASNHEGCNMRFVNTQVDDHEPTYLLHLLNLI